MNRLLSAIVSLSTWHCIASLPVVLLNILCLFRKTLHCLLQAVRLVSAVVWSRSIGSRHMAARLAVSRRSSIMLCLMARVGIVYFSLSFSPFLTYFCFIPSSVAGCIEQFHSEMSCREVNFVSPTLVCLSVCTGTAVLCCCCEAAVAVAVNVNVNVSI